MAPLIWLVGGFAAAGIFVGLRTFAARRRGSLERRRLRSLGRADTHRERYR